jgi:crotonobetainyl-CoA:carnitine CoA-transferase CaiB-like acyl-CoA transferase
VGTMGAAMSGATYQIGWPDREPAGPFGPWTDAVTPRFIVASILAALHRRSITGQGCYVDTAQAEAGIQFMMPAYYEYAANGTIPERRGIAGSQLHAPQGLYPCSGEDRWIAIDASSSTHWQAFRALIAELRDAKFDTIVGRLRNRDELEEAIAAWTREQEADAIENRMSLAVAMISRTMSIFARRVISTRSTIPFSAKRKSRARGSRSLAHRSRRLSVDRESASIQRKCWRRSLECRTQRSRN